jgi:hypothetical protein
MSGDQASLARPKSNSCARQAANLVKLSPNNPDQTRGVQLTTQSRFNVGQPNPPIHARPETRDPRPETRDPRPETRDPRPETRDPGSVLRRGCVKVTRWRDLLVTLRQPTKSMFTKCE